MMDPKMRAQIPQGQQPQPQPPQGPRRYDGQNGNPLYDPSVGGHYGACQKIALASAAPDPQVFTGAWANVSQGLQGPSQDILNVYWQNQVTKLETEEHDFKLHQLPLARIKKVMKADPEVKMISAEAPILFAKGCDVFITELTMRAWIHAEDNKRRTLQRSDIASALSKSDMFDFLIDIVPREEATSTRRSGAQSAAQQSAAASINQGSVQQGVHPPPPQMPPPEYAMDPHMAQPGMYAPQVQQVPQQVQQVQQPDAGAGAYGHNAQAQINEQFMYNAYAMTPQQIYHQGHPGLPQRAPDPEGDADAEGEREEYVG